MKKSLTSIVIFFFLSMAFSFTVKAQTVSNPKKGYTGSWRLLGTTQAKFSADHDAMYINGPYDFFRRINSKLQMRP